MKNYCRLLLSCAVVAFFGLSAAVVKAVPYACEVTNVAGNVQFYLGESADDVKVIFDDGAFTNDLGALSSGANSFALGVHTNYAIVVSKIGSGIWHQISVDATNNSFFGPRGIAVNRDPGNSYFGRVYVVNSSPGIGTPAPSQLVSKGIYVLNADTTYALALVNGTNGLTNGMVFGSSTTYSPYKVFVGSDGEVYIGDATGQYTGTHGSASVWMADPNISGATPVLAWTNNPNYFGGCISTPCVTGTLAAGNLALFGNFWGYSSNGVYTYIYGYDVGGALPCVTPPETNAIAEPSIDTVDGILGDLYIAPDGKFFASVDRSAATGSGNTSLYVFASDGFTYLWDSTTAGNGVDPLSATYGVAVSPDDKYVACINGGTGNVELALLTNGIPDFSTLATNAAVGGGTARGIAFDAADNVYVTSGGNDRVRVFSLGTTATCTTYNDVTGTNGSFNLVPLPTTISVTTTNSLISQANSYGNPTTSSFSIVRTGNLTGTLTVPISYGGSALGTSQYPASFTAGSTGSSVVLVPGEASTNITIKAVNDSIARPPTSVTITAGPGPGYNLSLPGTASITIVNTAPDEMFASVGIPSMYKAFSNDYCGMIITRWGDTNTGAGTITVSGSSFNFSGSAIEGTDFTPPTSVTFNPGDVTETNIIYPLVAGQLPVNSTNIPYTGDKFIVASVASGSGFSGSTNKAILTLIDNANPTASYLYSDPLTSVTDSNNWEETDANVNMQTNAIDSSVVFAYDLYDDPLDPIYLTGQGPGSPIPFPPGGATNSLRLTVNKLYSEYNSQGSQPLEGQGAAAAVNLFLTNSLFSGNYAVRFNMNLVEGALGLYTTEGALFGFNHTGHSTNWWAGSTVLSGWGAQNNEAWASDGIWCWVSVDGDVGAFDNGPSDYIVLTGNGGKLPNAGFELPPLAADGPLPNNFKSSVFTSSGEPGLAANGSPDNGDNDSSWSDVEMKQYNNIVTVSIDKIVIGSFTNTTSFTNGYVMLGYEDPYSSIGGGDAAVYYSNLRVVRLSPPLISETTLNAHTATYVFDFTSTDGEVTPSSFQVVASHSVQGPYTPVAGATIIQLGSGAFQATVPTSGAIEFYQIQQTL